VLRQRSCCYLPDGYFDPDLRAVDAVVLGDDLSELKGGAPLMLGPLMLLLLLLLPARLGFVPSDAATAARGTIKTPSLLLYLGR
jgi:hypothetical protein